MVKTLLFALFLLVAVPGVAQAPQETFTRAEVQALVASYETSLKLRDERLANLTEQLEILKKSNTDWAKLGNGQRSKLEKTGFWLGIGASVASAVVLAAK